MKTNKKIYSISQEILYTVCIAAWKLCSLKLTNFSALKAFYTEAFVANAMQAVKEAQQLPQSRATIEARTEARVNLMKSTRKVRHNWQVLKMYITKAFDEKLVKSKLQAAGASLYPQASADNWSAVRSLIEATNTFIVNNLDALTAAENMPAEFQATFKTGGDNCIAAYVIFSHINMEKETATSIKIDANNAIYASVIEMLKDGQQIFKEDVIMKRKFTFHYLVSMNRGERPASLKGKIVNNLNMPVAGAVILSQDERYMRTTNKKGQYHIKGIAAGTYIFTITCPGYDPLDQVITFVAGKASKGDFEMTNAIMKVA
jgi:hypothetical protein